MKLTEDQAKEAFPIVQRIAKATHELNVAASELEEALGEEFGITGDGPCQLLHEDWKKVELEDAKDWIEMLEEEQ